MQFRPSTWRHLFLSAWSPMSQACALAVSSYWELSTFRILLTSISGLPPSSCHDGCSSSGVLTTNGAPEYGAIGRPVVVAAVGCATTALVSLPPFPKGQFHVSWLRLNLPRFLMLLAHAPIDPQASSTVNNVCIGRPLNVICYVSL